MSDYRFSLQRPTQRFRPTLGLVLPTDTSVVTRISPTDVSWTEPSYTAQTREYASYRIPLFETKLSRIETETDRLVASYRARMSTGTVQGEGEQAVTVMPITGACPANGPLAYVYDDIFDAAKANLAALASEKPPRWSPVDLVIKWQSLIDWNIELLQRASNVDERFWFPDTVPRSYGTEVFNTFSGGSRRTIQSMQDGVLKDGHPYPLEMPTYPEEFRVIIGGKRQAQSFVDGAEATYLALRNALRVSGALIAPEVCRTTARSSYETCDARRMAAYDSPLDLLVEPGYESVANARLFPRRWSLTPTARTRYQDVFFTTVQQINAGQVKYGDPRRSTQSVGGAWDKLSTAFMKVGGTIWDFVTSSYLPMTGWAYWNPIWMLDIEQRKARSFSRVLLPQVISEAIGFYVFNHNVWYASKLGLSAEQLRAQQRAVAEAGLERTSGPILGVTGAVGSAVNPLIGVVVGILNGIGKELLFNFIQIRPDSPKPLFLRVPDPSVCEGRPEEQAGRSLCPPGTTGAYPNCVPVETPPPPAPPRSMMPVAAAAGAALLFMLAAKKKKKEGTRT